jgi:transcriptional repressor NrdR
MRCPYCKQDRDRVVDSRSASDGFVIRRRRECLGCERRYTTYERLEESPLRVVKKGGNRVAFDRSKIRIGIEKACEKRPVPADAIEEIVGRIEGAILERHEKEVPAKEIGRMVMEELRNLDQVAYVRFASVYREFKDVSQFIDELRPLLEKTTATQEVPEE